MTDAGHAGPTAGPARARLRLIMSTSPPPSEDLYAHLVPELRSLAQRGVLRTYRKNAVLINEGESGDSLFVLLKGSVKVFAMDESGREITYGTVEEGDYFGEMSLDGGPRSASVMTLEPCTCAVLSRTDVSEHLVQEPEFAINLVVQVIRRARSATETARNMALLDVYGRLVSLLEERRGEAAEGATAVLESITHQDIANRVGASREMVSRLLKDLEKGGYIELGIRRITLLKKLPSRW
jgi:CRP/FNR family cyclic AMP-dependent transcriptional regulator